VQPGLNVNHSSSGVDARLRACQPQICVAHRHQIPRRRWHDHGRASAPPASSGSSSPGDASPATPAPPSGGQLVGADTIHQGSFDSR
jgi:hypothetical protein